MHTSRGFTPLKLRYVCIMSSRAFRRLNRDVDIMKISEDAEKQDEEDEGPGFTSLACKKKGPVANPFVLVRSCISAYPHRNSELMCVSLY